MNDLWKLARQSGIALASVLVIAATACSVQVDPSKNGDKNVKIQTPVGGVQVKTDTMAASDIGLPVYPGATLATKGNDKDHDSADIHLGFGDWQMRLKVVKYHTSDSQEQVLDFYRKAMSRYGDVVQCQHNKPVGTPVVTREGLSCSDNDKNVHTSDKGIMAGNGSNELKAGSEKHQHIVGIEQSNSNGTDFSLLVLDLPSGMNGREARETN
jgi:hypothetical protein